MLGQLWISVQKDVCLECLPVFSGIPLIPGFCSQENLRGVYGSQTGEGGRPSAGAVLSKVLRLSSVGGGAALGTALPCLSPTCCKDASFRGGGWGVDTSALGTFTFLGRSNSQESSRQCCLQNHKTRKHGALRGERRQVKGRAYAENQQCVYTARERSRQRKG